MARTFLMIDGYNLMYAAGFGQPDYADGELQRCRHDVLKLLSALISDQQRTDTTIIFDAANAPPDRSRSQKFAKMQVLFAEAGMDADSTIESLIQAHSAPRQIMVVSSDHRLHRAARRRRAKAVDSQVFLRQLESSGGANQTNRKQNRQKNNTRATGELNRIDWLQEFGDIPGADELQREQDRSRGRFRVDDFQADDRS